MDNPRQSTSIGGRPKRALPVFSAVSLLFVVWLLAAALARSDYVPGPFSVLKAAVKLVTSGKFFIHFCDTVVRIVVGFGLAFLISVLTVLAMRKSEFWLRFFQVYLTLGLTVPALAWSAIAVMLVGLNSGAAVFTVAVVTFPTIATTLFEGIKSLDRDLLELAKVYRLHRWDRFRLVVLPQLLPYLFAACRSGVGLAWKAVVITEMIGLASGLGYQISVSYGLLSMQDVLAWTLLFTVAMIGLEYILLQQAERRLFRWKPQLPKI